MFHDFLAKNAQRLAAEDDPLLRSANSSPALERYREERAQLARLDRLERERELIPRRDTVQALEMIAGLIRRSGERLARRYGNDALQILDDALDDAERLIEQHFGEEAEVKGCWVRDQHCDGGFGLSLFF
jgi:hypothetical protein